MRHLSLLRNILLFKSGCIVWLALNISASAATLVDDNTQGFYNNNLGTTLDGSQAQFPLPFFNGGDPTIFPATEPDLSSVATILGDWLSASPALNGFWAGPMSIPATWDLYAETAIIYEVDAGATGYTNVLAAFDVDNGVFVWVNGQYKFGAVSGGSPSPTGQFEYTNVVLGVLSPGTNYIQVMREDNGFFTGYQIRVTGDPAPPPKPQITQQPTNQNVNLGQTATFSVAATSLTPISYQWWFETNPIPGATNSSLVLSNVQSSQAGNYSVTVANTAGSITSSNALLTLANVVVVVDGSTLGYYNESLGTVLDGTQPQFPLTFSLGGDPLIFPAAEPDLSPAAGVLSEWLAPNPVLNGNWSGLIPIPDAWATDAETAIIYAVDGGPTGFTNVLAQLDVDNGIFVWVNGQYKFGAVSGGSPSPTGQFEYTNVVLGALSPGTNYIQILREDNGFFTGYQIHVTGQMIPPPFKFSGVQQTFPAGIRLALNTEPGKSYRVQYVSDLSDTNWLTLTNFIGTSSVKQILDPTSAPKRWYRAVSP